MLLWSVVDSQFWPARDMMQQFLIITLDDDSTSSSFLSVFVLPFLGSQDSIVEKNEA